MNEISKFRALIRSLLRENSVGDGGIPGGAADVYGSTYGGENIRFNPYNDLLNAVKTDFGVDSNFYKNLYQATHRPQINPQEVEKIVRAHDRGNKYLAMLNLNEISSNLFKSALNVSKERGTDRRTAKLGNLYFNKFVGVPLMGGKISRIETHNPAQGNYRTIQIEIEKPSSIVTDKIKNDYVYYDIDKDFYEINEPIDRKDAVVLSKIALQINPESRYKETGKHFEIKGMNENDYGDEGPQPGDAEYHYSPPKHLKLSKLNDIDWEVAHESIVENTAILLEKAVDGIAHNLGDYYDDFGIPRELMMTLEDNGVIHLEKGTFPVFTNNEYIHNYNAFMKAVSDTWEEMKKPGINSGNDSEAPFLRGREPEHD